jgi:hypothetical protein
MTNENVGGTFRDRCYPVIQRLIAAEGMAEYWEAKGRYDFACNWSYAAIDMQMRLRDMAKILKSYDMPGSQKMAMFLLGYLR